MKFSDVAPLTSATPSMPLEPTFMLADTSDKVEGFFSRPILIFSEEWDVGLAFHYTINPWELFFENSRVRERLNNFALLRANLHIRIVVNSTKFYYGRLMASYAPLGPLDHYLRFEDGQQADFVEASQRPRVIINPSVDEIAVMKLPYMFPKSALSIPAREWQNMGTLTIADLNRLRNSNEATDAITVSIFAWATEVDYSQPTSLSIPNQGEYEENAPSGIVSKPATTIARLATKLASFPIIGPYAKATELVSSGVAALASLFGYCRPRDINPTTYYLNGISRRLATTNIQDETDVLALDCKKEVPIDPRVIGASPEDHMAMVPLAKKESYLTTFPWSSSNATDTVLYNFRVNPMMYALDDQLLAHLTPMAWLSVPFKYWRGTLRYRFEVVCSAFHRGRLRLMYDPVKQDNFEYNLNYTDVIDICDTVDYTMEIGWAQGVPYSRVLPFKFDEPYHRTTPFEFAAAGNGVISVVVLNSLTTPSPVETQVDINVYVSASDDFELQEPSTKGLQNLVPYTNGNNPFPPVEPGDLSNTLGTFPVYAQFGSDKLAKSVYGPTGTLIGGTSFTENFVESRTLNIFDLDTTNNDRFTTFTLATTQWPTGTPGVVDVSTTLETLSVQFNSPNENGLNIANVRLAIPDGADNLDITFDSVEIPWSSELVITDVRAPFSVYSADVRIRNLIFTQTTPVTSREDDYNAYIRMLPSSSGVYFIPSGNMHSVMYAAPDGPSQITLISGGDVRVSALQECTVPRQSATLTPLPVATHVTIEVTGANTVEIYAFGILGVDNQGDVDDNVQSQTTVAGTGEEKPQLSNVFFGEIPVSIRQLFKRYTTAFQMDLESQSYNREVFPTMPKGFALPQLNEVEMSLWDWFIPGFLGWKGSTRVKAIPSKVREYGMSIMRIPEGSDTFFLSVTEEDRKNLLSWNGATYGLGDNFPEAELPWYSNLRFLPARTAPSNQYFEPVPAFEVEVLTAGNNDRDFMHILMATGEDFSTYFYVCPPIISPPT